MKQEFRIIVDSPYESKRPIDQFEHFMRKVASDADVRWGIELEIERIDDEPDVSDDDFERGNQQ